MNPVLQPYHDPDADRFGRAPRHYVPQARSVTEIFKEDIESQQQYALIAENDDDVQVTGNCNEFHCFQSWSEADFPPTLLDNLRVACYVRPRKIQATAIPFILDGYDVIVQAETGCGKTAAFLLPIIDGCMYLYKNNLISMQNLAPLAIVLEPTREMVEQVFEQAQKLANNTGITVARAYGEFDYYKNVQHIYEGCDILICTPGRLMHFLAEKQLILSSIEYLVLDEGDRLLDRKFQEDIKFIVSREGFPKPENRQTLIFSATFPANVLEATAMHCKVDAVRITNEKSAPNRRITQEFVLLEQPQKMQYLHNIMMEELKKVGGPENKIPRTLVFVNTKVKSDMIAYYLSQKGIPTLSIHSDRPQDLRLKVINKFRKHEICVVAATDVCARGIDVKELDCVINFDMPDDLATYLFRIGRTGRIKPGYSLSFVSPADEPLLEELRNGMKKDNVHIPESLNGILDHENRDGQLLDAINMVNNLKINN